MKRPNHAAKPATPPEPATSTAPEPKAEPAAPLALALVEPAAAVNVALSELDAARYVTARVKTADQATIDAYAERTAAGDSFPPIEVFRDESGLLWLGDGVHRTEAARKNGAKAISARVSEGGRLAALRHAAGANEQHGLRRTPADKRQAVLLVLADPELSKLSSRQIAELARVSHTFAEHVRSSTGVDSNSERRKGKDGKARASRKPAPGAPERPFRSNQMRSKTKKALRALGPQERWTKWFIKELLEAVAHWADPNRPVGADKLLPK